MPPGEPTSTDAATTPATADPMELLRDRRYLVILVLGALTGVPVAAVAYFFLQAVNECTEYVFDTLPDDLGFDGQPAWWPILPLAVGGLIVALAIGHLPGTGGHKPAEGFHTGGPVPPIELPTIAIASFATLVSGAVLGPEAPLIAIGSGLGVLIVRLIRRDAPEMAIGVIGAAGSFAAISTLLGSPLASVFLLMEASGLGGATMSVVLVPGLLASGVGALIYVGLDDWTGFGTFSLSVSDLPDVGTPTLAEFLWAIAIGVLAAFAGAAISRGSLWLQPIVERSAVLLTPAIGAAVGVCVLVYVTVTDESSSDVLFSGQEQLGPFMQGADDLAVGTLALLLVCKGAAYTLSLSCFRGGPVFPAMFIGAVGGVALSHFPGLPLVVGAGMGIGAMAVAMLRLPLVSVLLVAVFLQAGLALMPTVIVAVTVSYVVSARLRPPDPAAAAGGTSGAPA